MNNRIQDLALESMVKYIASEAWVFTDAELENFAQSIVKECAKIAEDTQKFYDEHNDGVVNTEIWTMIKLHFGVQE